MSRTQRCLITDIAHTHFVDPDIVDPDIVDPDIVDPDTGSMEPGTLATHLPGSHAFDGFGCRAFVTRDDSPSVCNAVGNG